MCVPSSCLFLHADYKRPSSKAFELAKAFEPELAFHVAVRRGLADCAQEIFSAHKDAIKWPGNFSEKAELNRRLIFAILRLDPKEAEELLKKGADKDVLIGPHRIPAAELMRLYEERYYFDPQVLQKVAAIRILLSY